MKKQVVIGAFTVFMVAVAAYVCREHKVWAVAMAVASVGAFNYLLGPWLDRLDRIPKEIPNP